MFLIPGATREKPGSPVCPEPDSNPLRPAL